MNEYLNPNLKIDYIALSELKNEKNCLLKKIYDISLEEILFDWKFSIENETNKLYCSEFIVKVLNDCNRNLIIESFKVKLNSLHAAFIGKDSLDYYPVDVLIRNESVNFIKEWQLN